eukprot:SAG31_NODE_3716_length_3953_cov_1.724961_2_plen_106_part_00
MIFNHITVKLPDTEDQPGGPYFLINPFGLRFDEITASSLLKVRARAPAALTCVSSPYFESTQKLLPQVDVEGNIVDKGDGSGAPLHDHREEQPELLDTIAQLTIL